MKKMNMLFLASVEFSFIKAAESYPELLHYIPQLFPGNFKKIISLDEDKLKKLKTVLTDNPGFLAFKAVSYVSNFLAHLSLLRVSF
jgi:hypothetical protein